MPGTIIDGYSNNKVLMGSRFYSFFRSRTAKYSTGEFKVAEDEDNFIISDDEIVLPCDYVDGNYKDYIGNKIKVAIPGLEIKEYTIKDFSSYYTTCLISDNNYRAFNEYYLKSVGNNFVYYYLIDVSTTDTNTLLKFLEDNSLYLYFGNSSKVYFDIKTINLNFSYLFELKNKTILIYILISIFIICIFNLLSHKNTCLYISLGIRNCEIYKYKFIGLIKFVISSHLLGLIIFAMLSYYYTSKLISASSLNYDIEYFKVDSALIFIFAAIILISIGSLINIIMPKKIYSSLSEA
jgi:hypothetical protein